MIDGVLLYSSEDRGKDLTFSGVLFIIHLQFCTF